jgi:hypothetical protein
MIGANLDVNKLTFSIYAPYIEKPEISISSMGKYELEKDDLGYFRGAIDNVREGMEYLL